MRLTFVICKLTILYLCTSNSFFQLYPHTLLIKNFSLKIAVVALAIPLVLSNCTKKETADITVPNNLLSVKVLSDGRMAFATTDAFNQTFNQIWSMTNPQIDKWEASIGFHSLRSAQKTDTSLARFDFPAQYAALISEKGEYQIGDRINWYHDGYRYVAHSEEELIAIKANPSLATEKFSAGIRQNTPIAVASDKKEQAVSRTIRSSDSQNGDGK